ncbi:MULTISPECIES: siderophore-iron reductase FhuF [Glaesserella]|uniref:Siderophore-iron reductase FhuF n=1 Tax=Glaesserella australis TaxID=2094024 RepID=A0A328C0X5_9PAST|nr:MULTISPECIES: siderophore-iron reductase FhuF [Glaesserella]AUI66976.1 siderophore-iron reductase FhuF [Glaesserella sp. 15-184]RAL18932.1 siderophore-iron reductase FhuF [Glaesserella australis]
MNLLFNCLELNQLRQNLFSDRLKHCRNLLTFVEKPDKISNAMFFQQLYHSALPASFSAVLAEPQKATLSMWQRYWLNGFIMHWVWLLHKYHLHLVLSEQGTALDLTTSGKIRGFLVNLSYTPVRQAKTNAEKLKAYQQLKQFLSPIFNRLTAVSRLNEAVFWHNCANLIEFSLKELEADGVEINETYRQLLLEKKWNDYEWSPFYNTVEYIPFPDLPFPQPVRLRKVCCHAHLDSKNDYCGNCPKLKKISKEELAELVRKWG